MCGAGRDAARRPTRLRGTTAWARGSDAFRRWTDTFVSAGTAVRRGAPSIGRPMTQFPCLVSAAPRGDAKAPRYYFAAPATRLETTAVRLCWGCVFAPQEDERPNREAAEASMMRAACAALESEEASPGDAWPYPSVGRDMRR